MYKRLLLTVGLITLVVAPAFSHIRIYPIDSTYGAREKYTMRVPNEKQVESNRIEG